ncbi:MAG: branched-chain amino acid ABC transporter permease [Mycobacteriaceae bacterium]|nr:branched-chain amino acid ABC transporter permease [Mycobacteriaceae bacterium]
MRQHLSAWWNALSRPAQWAFAVPAIVALVVLPVYPPPVLNTPDTNFGGVMAQFGILALVAIGLNVVVGQTGLLNLGYVGFYAVGAYSVALLTSPNSPWNRGWSWWACLPVAAIVTGVAGLLLGVPTLRLRGDYLAIVTLGFGEIVRLLADNLDNVTRGSLGLENVAYPHVGESATKPHGVFSSGNLGGHGGFFERANSGAWWFWLGIALVVLVLLVVGNLERSRVGRAWVAIREDEDVAEIMGVPTFKFKLWSVAIGAMIGGVSGAMYAGQVQCVDPAGFDVINSRLFLVAVVLGGQGNKLGVIVGAFVIVYLPNRLMSVEVGGQSLGDFKYLFFGLALVVLMIFRPQGLLPARQKLLAFGGKVRDMVGRKAEVGQ